jgi:WD40 repeat protein
MPLGSSSRRTARRSFVGGALGAGILKGLGAMSLAPAILSREAEAAPQLAQGGRAASNGGPRMRLDLVRTFRPPGNPSQIFDFKLSPDGRRIAILAPTSTLHVHEFPSFEPIAQVQRIPESTRGTFAFLADGECILSTPHETPGARGGSTAAATIYSSTTGERLFDIAKTEEWLARRRAVSFVATASDGTWPVVQGRGSDLEFGVIDLATRAIARTYRRLDGLSFYAPLLAISRDGVLAAVPSHFSPRVAAPIELVRMTNGEVRAVLAANKPAIESLAWSDDGTLLATAGRIPHLQQDGRPASDTGERELVWIWDVRTGQRVAGIGSDLFPVGSLSISENNAWLVGGNRAKRSFTLGSGVSIWRIADGQEVFAYESRNADLVIGATFTRDMRHVVWFEGDVLKVYSVTITAE